MIERDENGVLHIVAVSGGKDSTALALALIEREPRPYTFVCTPTGDELPEMFDHWRWLGSDNALGKPILPVMAHTGLNGLIDEQNALPNNRMRWCTRILKIEPYHKWLRGHLEEGPVVSYVGLRADEPERAGAALEHPDIATRYPMREWGWSIDDVWQFLEARGVTVPERTDCARCYHQRLGEWWRLWREYPEIYADAEAQEAKHGHTFRNPQRDTWPAELVKMRERFEAGEIPPRTKLQIDLFRNIGECRVCTL